jgi:DNA sulfur modification protein DndB
MITVGEDTANLSFTSFDNAFTKSTLLPKASGSKFKEDSVVYAMYDTNEQDREKAMTDSKNRITDFVIRCYSYVKEEYPEIYDKDSKYILSIRGVVPFICLISDLRNSLIDRNHLSNTSSSIDCADAITKYLKALIDGLKNLSIEEKEKILGIQGKMAETLWLRMFQDLINKVFPEYNPPKLIEWRETQDKELQKKGLELGQAVIQKIKNIVIEQLQLLFGKHWDLEINTIKNTCTKRANDQMAKHHKDGVEFEEIEWTDMLEISELKTIIERFWSREKENSPSFKTFESIFSYDIGDGFNTKAEKTKWLSVLSSYKDLWSSDTKGLNKSQIDRLESIYKFVIKS